MARKKKEVKFQQHKSPRQYFFPLLEILDGDERERRFNSDVPEDYKPLVRKYLDIYTERILFSRRDAPPPPVSLRDMRYGCIEFW
jgi:hypothetical protein